MARAPLVLLTRPQDASDRFAKRLAAQWPGLEVIIAPLQAVRFVPWQRPQSPPDALIFTSQNAVDAVAMAGLEGLAYCVGNQTADRAARAGFRAISAEGGARDLVARILADGPKSVWHLRGREARGEVAGQLRRHGLAVFEAEVYEMTAVALDPAAKALLGSGRPVLLPLFSPKSAVRAAAALAGTPAPLVVLALSEAVARAAKDIPARFRLVSKRPDADGMLEIVDEALISGALS